MGEIAKPVAFDNFLMNKFSGSFLLIDKRNNETLACGLIDDSFSAKPFEGYEI